MRVLGEQCEVLLTEDLGPVDTLMDYIGRHADDVDMQCEVEDFVVGSAAAMLLDARVIDDDHSVLNMVRSRATGQFHRIDFEVALSWDSSREPARDVGGMLGRMTTTYAYAFQPNVVPVERMVRRLVGELSGKVPRTAWTIAHDLATNALERQRLKHGIDMRPDLSPLAAAGRS
jgi:ABC-type histidine transport system ATPase subunit